MTTRYSSHAIARLADLTLVPASERGLVRQRGPWLEVGPDASDDLIVSVACRRIARKQHAESSEETVRELVEEHGYIYVAPAGPRIADARSDRVGSNDIPNQYVQEDTSTVVAR